MSKSKKEVSVNIKRAYQRHVAIDENIHSTLSLEALSLYMTFRYEADYRCEESDVKRTARFLYTKAKIRRSKYFTSLNELEEHGLILRSEENTLGEACTFHVARELNYFTSGKSSPPVHELDTPVHEVDTFNQYSLPNNINIISDILETYHEELPDLPVVRKVDTKLRNQLKKMVKDWPSYQSEGKSFTVESFRNYLKVLKAHHGWILKPYVTDTGNSIKCSLRKITREINISRVVNGEFSATS